MSLSVKKKVASNKRHASKDAKQTSHSVRRKKHSMIDYKILAERNPSVMAVGAWVESVHEWQEHPNVSTGN